ncbi:hypothetical protein SEPCBS119000_006249 [Sporothrix epigloea]|uniref:F-box domain-containing protein n=1 Tax=Sporothrix epigloea TaxID=1892477 RepID=A0ABP0E557_9PEZI
MVIAHADPSLAMGQDYLSRLPVELLVRIARDLRKPFLCAFRQCGRTLERALYHYFVEECFRSKQFMLSEYSLQTLLDMARHPVLSQTLRHVSIGLEEIRVAKKKYTSDEKRAELLVTAVVEQKALMANGLAVQLMAAAFSLLPNLETVQLCDRGSHTPFGEEPRNAMISQGLRQQLGLDSLRRSVNPKFSSRAFALVVTALAQSTARPPNLEVLLRKKLNGLHYFAFDLTPAPRLGLHGSASVGGDGNGKVSALPVLAGLRRLHLKLRFSFNSSGFPHNDIYDGSYTHPASVESLPLRAWLAHCPKLEWLRLELESEADVYNDIFLEKLGDPLPAFYPLPPESVASRDIPLPFASHLRRLDLGTAGCDENVLLHLLLSLPVLEHLSLWRFSMVSDKSSPEGTWEVLFDVLAVNSPGQQLKRLTLKRLYVMTRPDETTLHMRVTHDVRLNNQYDVDLTVEAGESMASWLQNVWIDYSQSYNWDDSDSDTGSEWNSRYVVQYGSDDEHEELD